MSNIRKSINGYLSEIGPAHRFPFIDAMRGYAILGVIFVHASQRIQDLPLWLKIFSSQGARGVQLFFIISSLTLFLSIRYRSTSETDIYFNFFIRRFFRIAPLFYIGILLYVLSLGFSPRYRAPDGISLIHIMSTFFFAHGWHPDTIAAVVPGSWAIAVEMNFYLIIPTLYGRIKNVYVASFCCAISLLVTIPLKKIGRTLYGEYPYSSNLNSFLFQWLPTQIPIFFFGIILYFILRNTLDEMRYSREIVKKKGSLPLLLLSLSLLVTYPYFVKFNLVNYIDADYLYAYGLILSIFVYSVATCQNILFVNKAIIYLGKISFSAYIVHQYILTRLNSIRADLLSSLTDYFPSVLVFILFLILSMLTIITVSTLTYKFIEVPGINIGKNIISRKIRNT